jgi:1-acyl-sn-glycerol-3-phosphate acyltransferase
MVPPRFVRRLVFAPLLIALAAAAGVLTPLLLLIGLVASHGRHRLLRLTLVAVAWLALETAAVGAAFWLWVSGNGSRRERYYALCGWFLSRVYGIATRAFGLVVEIQEPLNASSDRPVIVLSRHAGPGDSLLIVHFLLNVYGRRPRIVLKAALQLDPALDAVLNRLPNAFVPGSGAPREDAVTAIERLATGMDSGDAMLIFPAPPRTGDPPSPPARPTGAGVPRAEDGERPAAAPGRHPRGDRGRARRRRGLRGAHRGG